MYLHHKVKDLLSTETCEQLQAAGWLPLTGRASGAADAALLQPQVLSSISCKLGRRPVAASIPARLMRALGASEHMLKGRLFAERLPAKRKPLQEVVRDAAAEAEEGQGARTQGEAGSSKRQGSSFEAATLDGTGGQQKKRKKRRAVVLSETEDGGSDFQPEQTRRKVRGCAGWELHILSAVGLFRAVARWGLQSVKYLCSSLHTRLLAGTSRSVHLNAVFTHRSAGIGIQGRHHLYRAPRKWHLHIAVVPICAPYWCLGLQPVLPCSPACFHFNEPTCCA